MRIPPVCTLGNVHVQQMHLSPSTPQDAGDAPEAAMCRASNHCLGILARHGE